MTEDRLVDFTENLMIYLIDEIRKQKKLGLTAKVHLLNSIRGALIQVDKLQIK